MADTTEAQPQPQDFRFSLRDLAHFPTLSLLPRDNDPSGSVDLRYYEDPGDEPDGISDPVKHWCLLVQIVYHTATDEELIYNVRDREGKNFFVIFYREGESLQSPGKKEAGQVKGGGGMSSGERPWQKYCKPGNCMAVMYACSHAFEDGALGVQVTESENVKSFPCSLDTFLLLGDELEEPPTKPKQCSACDKPGPHNCTLLFPSSPDVGGVMTHTEEVTEILSSATLESPTSTEFLQMGQYIASRIPNGLVEGPISTLPEEIILLILDMLVQEDIAAHEDSPRGSGDTISIVRTASQVCHFWRFITLQNTVWWSHIHVFPPWRPHAVAAALARSKDCPIELRISMHLVEDATSDTDDPSPTKLDGYEELFSILHPHHSPMSDPSTSKGASGRNKTC
ncbi:hypothetical protein NLJ89_g10152 [Agrocybe chaxingu]|uniref:F-box domain-containing protein n=1 Tax=Agrocybe chaxingu TaxID=84603 RepID=A0A9W8JRQ2_9AGAR|nr:hypothetical protein NLJ89_g10152 [Agrocybe chaxingu]